MRYGVHNNELLDRYFYYDPCISAWIVQDSDTLAAEFAIHLLEEKVRSSSGLDYQGIFNHHIVFHNGHWIPVASMASQSPLLAERRAYSELTGLANQQGICTMEKGEGRCATI
jgi:hypothetical protein